MKSLSRFLALEGNIRVLAAQTLISQIGFGMFYVVWQPYLLSTGISLSQLGVVQTMINVSTWTPGIYLAVVYEDGKPVGRSKFVVQ